MATRAAGADDRTAVRGGARLPRRGSDGDEDAGVHVFTDAGMDCDAMEFSAPGRSGELFERLRPFNHCESLDERTFCPKQQMDGRA